MSSPRQIATQKRIDEQLLVVAALVPGSEEHRLATKVLLVMQDCLATYRDVDALLAAARPPIRRAAE